MADSTLAFNILARDLGASSAFEKVARAADNTSSSLSKTIKVSDEAAKASERLTKAHDDEDSALGKVRVAEARLAELRGNSKSKTSQIIAAEENLSKARRNAASASNVAQKAAKDLGNVLDNEGKKAGKSLGSSLKRWFTGDGKNVFKQVGEDGGTVFGSGLLGALKTPILGPAIIATVGGAVAVAAPAVGAIAGAGIVSGFGAGIAGLGLVFAAKSKVVQDKWKSVLNQMGADMKLLSAPFDATLISIAGTFQRTVDKFNPALAKAFQKSAVPIENFADQAGKAMEKLVPAIAPVTDAFNRVLGTLGPALQDAVQSLSQGLIDLAHSVERNPDALADMTREVGTLSRDLLGFIGTMNDANGKFKQMTGGTSLVTAAFEGMRFILGVITGPLTLLAKTVSGVSDTVNALKHDTDASGQSMVDAANKTTALAKGLQTAGDGAKHAADANKQAAPAVESLAAKFARQSAATDKLVQSLFRLQNGYITLAGAQVSYQAALDAGTQSVKDNGKTLDINTAKGRANKQALIDLAQSANAQTESMLRNNKGSVAAAGAAEKSRANFVRLAMQMGATKPQAVAMAKSMIAIPNVTREAKLKANKKDLDTKLAAARHQLADPKLTATKKAQLKAEIGQLLAAKARAQAAIDSLHGKTVTIITNYTSKGVNLQAPSSVGRRAAGGPVKKGMPYIVGEHRPELFVPKQDGEIVPRLPRSAKGTALTTAPTPVAVSLKIESGGSRMDDLIVELLRRYIRVNGGNVQAVLGR
jgi:hypothetical protein